MNDPYREKAILVSFGGENCVASVLDVPRNFKILTRCLWHLLRCCTPSRARVMQGQTNSTKMMSSSCNEERLARTFSPSFSLVLCAEIRRHLWHQVPDERRHFPTPILLALHRNVSSWTAAHCQTVQIAFFCVSTTLAQTGKKMEQVDFNCGLDRCPKWAQREQHTQR